VPEEVKNARVEELMHIQQSISLQINERRIGEVLPVIIDRREGDYFIGRTEYDSPEVDNEVIIQSKPDLAPGNFVNVNIKEAREFDLFGFSVG
jgi:ribosomal protein S12 methylthiotransferase